MTSQSPEDFQKRLEALEDEKGILETLHRYTQANDNGPAEAIADVFTNDGVFDVASVSGKPVYSLRGRAELIRHHQSRDFPPLVCDKHLILSPVIEITGHVARVDAYWMILREFADGGPTILAWGHYRNRLEKQERKWLIKEMVARTETGSGRAFNGGPPRATGSR